ncbi:MAG: hypothetical protein R2703_09655 [Micropruina glycogenica]
MTKAVGASPESHAQRLLRGTGHLELAGDRAGRLEGAHLDPKNIRLEVADAKVKRTSLRDLFVEDALGLVEEGICKVKLT